MLHLATTLDFNPSFYPLTPAPSPFPSRPQLVTCAEVKKQELAVHATCRPTMNTPKPKPEPPAKEEAKPAAEGDAAAAAGAGAGAAAGGEAKGEEVPAAVS